MTLLQQFLIKITGTSQLVNQGFAYWADNGKDRLYYWSAPDGTITVGKNQWSLFKHQTNETLEQVREMQELFPDTF